MKKTLFYMFTLLLCALLMAALPVSGEEKIYTSVVRLHVLANSDEEADQALKLLVRDEILREYGPLLAEEARIEDSVERIGVLLPAIQKTAEEVVKREGYAYTVSCSFGEEKYPERQYGDYSFPAGTYLSLRISIGEGVGQNWWCVLFPPLCLDMAKGEVLEDDALAVGLTSEEYKLISGNKNGGYVLKFKALELLEGVFR